MVDCCRPLKVEVFALSEEVKGEVLEGWKPPECPAYKGVHGLRMPVFEKGKGGVGGTEP